MLVRRTVVYLSGRRRDTINGFKEVLAGVIFD